MAYDEGLAQRLREVFAKVTGAREKKMFGGLAFMVNGHLAGGVIGEALMVRVGPEAYARALERPHTREMDFTGRPMKGFVVVDPSGFETDEQLADWVASSLEFVHTLPPK
ncbi:MAG: TfoX/Sxy family protein [Verrucomicrobiales bacterium]|nr:TfoX/Sxy family protein [Verrucomicrobiales bacterium]MCP5526748.1 TfoX/Sxy family protein [Verrucomicrobiales bacterium]